VQVLQTRGGYGMRNIFLEYALLQTGQVSSFCRTVFERGSVHHNLRNLVGIDELNKKKKLAVLTVPERNFSKFPMHFS
jgi:hypothetical protein